MSISWKEQNFEVAVEIFLSSSICIEEGDTPAILQKAVRDEIDKLLYSLKGKPDGIKSWRPEAATMVDYEILDITLTNVTEHGK